MAWGRRLGSDSNPGGPLKSNEIDSTIQESERMKLTSDDIENLYLKSDEWF